MVIKESPISNLWHPTKNSEFKKTEISYISNIKFWWKCSEGHEWFISPRLLTKRLNKCSTCFGQILVKGVNDLKTTHPFLMQEWDYSKNSYLPDEVKAGSTKKVWWVCDKGYEWEARIDSRASGSGCRCCPNRKILTEDSNNDLISRFSDLIHEWHPTKNSGILPKIFLISPTKKCGG